MEAELEQLYRTTVPKPGCPGTRIDTEGREWYSAGWIDHHPEEINLDELPVRETEPGQLCEFSGCDGPAEVYGGFAGAGEWAGRACLECAATVPGFSIWDRLGA